MGDVILVRHGATTWNKETPGPEKFRGWTDVPLHQLGIEEAHRLGKALTNEPIHAIFSSDLSRAHNTAQTIGAHHNPPLDAVPTAQLRPWNVGELSGQDITPEKLKVMKQLETQIPDQSTPGGESFNQFLGRYIPTISQLVDAASQMPGHIVAVAHTRNLRAAEAWVNAGAQGLNVDPRPLLTDKEIAPGGFIRLRRTSNGVEFETNHGTPGLAEVSKDIVGPKRDDNIHGF